MADRIIVTALRRSGSSMRPRLVIIGRVAGLLRHVVTAANTISIIFIVATTGITAGCSSQTCAHSVTSEEEAKSALASFFSSNGVGARRLIASLREDGMTDEYLAKLRGGCASCNFFRGDENSYDKGRWYVSTWIAAPANKKSVVFQIECATVVRLDHTLYGG